MKAKYINTAKEEVSLKKFNIFIGISLGNKFFSKRNLKEYISWALENTCKEVVILIADDLHAINYSVLNGLEEKEALEKVRKLGDEIERMLKKIILDIGNNKNVQILHWRDILSKEYSEKVDVTYKEFKDNLEFREAVLSISNEFVEARNISLSEGEEIRLAGYILNELPLLIEGLHYNGRDFELLPYPVRDSLDELILDIQKGEIFQDYLEKLNVNQLRKIVVLK